MKQVQQILECRTECRTKTVNFSKKYNLKSKVIISRTKIKKVKMTVCKSHVSLICPENIKPLSFIVSKQRTRQDVQGNGDIKVTALK